jgi:hypothetical protein
LSSSDPLLIERSEDLIFFRRISWLLFHEGARQHVLNQEELFCTSLILIA